jgi:hypothetical protein
MAEFASVTVTIGPPHVDRFREALEQGEVEFHVTDESELKDGSVMFHAERVAWAEFPKVEGVPMVGSNGEGDGITPLEFAYDGEKSKEMVTYDGNLIVSVDMDTGEVMEDDLISVREFIDFRKGVMAKMGIQPETVVSEAPDPEM